MSQTTPDDQFLPVEDLRAEPKAADELESEPPLPDDGTRPEPGPEPEPVTRRCRRFVNVTTRVKRGRGVKLFAYSYADLSALLALSEPAIRQAVKRGKFEPGDLRSVFEFLLSRLGDRRVRERLLGDIAETEPADKEEP